MPFLNHPTSSRTAAITAGTVTVSHSLGLKSSVAVPNRAAAKAVGSAMDKDIPLPKGRMFIDDILGFEIIDADSSKVYGTLQDVTSNGAHDIYHIKCGEKTVLFPAVDEFIDRIDTETSAIYVKPIGGMFE